MLTEKEKSRVKQRINDSIKEHGIKVIWKIIDYLDQINFKCKVKILIREYKYCSSYDLKYSNFYKLSTPIIHVKVHEKCFINNW